MEDITDSIRDAAAHVARALGITMAELAETANTLSPGDQPARSDGENLLLALGEIVRSEPSRYDLVDAAEAAKILGVSRSRLHLLAETKPDFPQQRYPHLAGKLWRRQDINAFNKTWDRRVGRPPKAR
ncbi:hypothetical protein GCM10009733_070040 [Nonomuraea maheshkhaliensis]|uniref:DNA-binding protein n=1 Tax=Nonomuraea maheshkhaliensis TaxID=419590 RepID=A0ABP4S062_9ACTN